jgi:2-polyprenyl-6-hydroxyphenyl methylase/3-demethylubiquinone-9 3-methyltransferase
LFEKSNERYDVVACLEVLEHVPDPKLLVKTCVELLNPGGFLFLSTINKKE